MFENIVIPRRALARRGNLPQSQNNEIATKPIVSLSDVIFATLNYIIPIFIAGKYIKMITPTKQLLANKYLNTSKKTRNYLIINTIGLLWAIYGKIFFSIFESKNSTKDNFHEKITTFGNGKP